MPTNFYFNHFPRNITNEQLLVEDLLIESLKIYGMDCYYLPREVRAGNSIDTLMGEDQLKTYTKAYPLEMYLENVSGMDGEQDIISKFGLEIRDEITLLVSRRRFKYHVGVNRTRPLEGDLIYVPLVQNFFEIMHVEHENDQAMFYTLGRGRGANVYVYALKLKQFVFSDEVIETGISEIDDQIKIHYRGTHLIMSAGGIRDYDAANNETVFQGANLASATAFAEVRNWYTSNNTLEIIMVNGEFAANTLVIGESSNAQWTLASTDTDSALENQTEDIVDNKEIETEADQILDFSEHNPFGEP
jgi:hypothetical protein